MDLQHADVPRLQLGHQAGLQLGPEGPPVHPLPEVDRLRDDAGHLVLPKVLLGQEVLPEQQPGAADVLLVAHDVDGGSWGKRPVNWDGHIELYMEVVDGSLLSTVVEIQRVIWKVRAIFVQIFDSLYDDSHGMVLGVARTTI